MHCRSVEKQIQALLDERRDPNLDAELIEHAVDCEGCRDLLAAQGKLFDGLLQLEVPCLPADFSQQVVGAVMTQKHHPGRRFAPVAAVVAIVATLLLVVALGPPPQNTIGSTDTSHVVAAVNVNDSGTVLTDFDSHEMRLAIEHFVTQITHDGVRFYQVDQIAGTIRPIASTLNVAFDAIRRSIPRRRQPIPDEPQATDLRYHWVERVS